MQYGCEYKGQSAGRELLPIKLLLHVGSMQGYYAFHKHKLYRHTAVFKPVG